MHLMTHNVSKGGEMINKGLFTSNNNEWGTPVEFYNKLDKEFHFTLDVCASLENHKCNKFFTKEQNGLIQEWKDEVAFCNPPYGREISKWVEKCYRQHQIHNITVVMLLPARTDTKWFHNFIYHKSEIRFIKGRLKFNDQNNPAPFPSMVVVYKKIDK